MLPGNKKRLIKEIRDLPNESHPHICIAIDNEKINQWKVLILGPSDTPFAYGFYLFDFEFPDEYPWIPPKVKFHSLGIRPHPNLYADGKVCLSILGTWNGPSWTPAFTGMAVANSISSLLIDNPISAEPGFENEPSTSQKAMDYRILSAYFNIKFYVLHMMKNLRTYPENIVKFISQTFANHHSEYSKQVKWLQQYNNQTIHYIGGLPCVINSDHLMDDLTESSASDSKT